jgi:predicted NUDIX family NTP pyrophosphohydrolase
VRIGEHSFQAQPGHAREVADVSGHHHEIMLQRGRGNLQIGIASTIPWSPFRPESGPSPASGRRHGVYCSNSPETHPMATRKSSCGILMYRVMYRERTGRLEVFLVHPGGPFWAARDLGAWSIPKGEPAEGEDPLAAARREFAEETGFDAGGLAEPLTPVRQAGGKVVQAWAVAGDCDPAAMRSNTFPIEWPPRSGKMREFPEADRGEWFETAAAKEKINPAQRLLVEELERRLGGLSADRS